VRTDKRAVEVRQQILQVCASSGLPAWTIVHMLDSARAAFLESMYEEAVQQIEEVEPDAEEGSS